MWEECGEIFFFAHCLRSCLQRMSCQLYGGETWLTAYDLLVLLLFILLDNRDEQSDQLQRCAQ